MRAICSAIERGIEALLHELFVIVGKFSELLGILIFMMAVGCVHSRMGRPLTVDGVTYRICADCGAYRLFDLSNWRMRGAYFYNFPQDAWKTPVSHVASRTAEGGQFFGQQLKQAA